MSRLIVLASASASRATMLSNANIPFEAVPARVDEESIRMSLVAEGAKPRDIVDALAEAKARKVANKHQVGCVLGSDQILVFEDEIISKSESSDDCIDLLKKLQGKRHDLMSAAVLYEGGEPVWRHIGKATLMMRPMSNFDIEKYVDRNWASIQHSVGGYKIEEEGVRLFSSITGDHFTILGLPLLPLINFLTTRGDLTI